VLDILDTNRDAKAQAHDLAVDEAEKKRVAEVEKKGRERGEKAESKASREVEAKRIAQEKVAERDLRTEEKERAAQDKAAERVSRKEEKDRLEQDKADVKESRAEKRARLATEKAAAIEVKEKARVALEAEEQQDEPEAGYSPPPSSLYQQASRSKEELDAIFGQGKRFVNNALVDITRAVENEKEIAMSAPSPPPSRKLDFSAEISQKVEMVVEAKQDEIKESIEFRARGEKLEETEDEEMAPKKVSVDDYPRKRKRAVAPSKQREDEDAASVVEEPKQRKKARGAYRDVLKSDDNDSPDARRFATSKRPAKSQPSSPPRRRARESYTSLNDKTLIDEEDFDMDLDDSDEEIINTQLAQIAKIVSARKQREKATGNKEKPRTRPVEDRIAEKEIVKTHDVRRKTGHKEKRLQVEPVAAREASTKSTLVYPNMTN
jgi:hypothetical protein